MKLIDKAPDIIRSLFRNIAYALRGGKIADLNQKSESIKFEPLNIKPWFLKPNSSPKILNQ